MILWASAELSGCHCPYWLTYRQAQELGGLVRKGEKGSPVVYASTFTRQETAEDGSEQETEVPFLKQYTVFNACQVEGLPQDYYRLATPPRETVERIDRADRFFAASGAEIRTGGNRAYYAITDDYIQMPPIECFRDSESHAATLAHELTHWTRHPSRLNRDLGRKKYADAHGQGTVVWKMGARARQAAHEVQEIFAEVFDEAMKKRRLTKPRKAG